jgi:hypothetical protein
MHKKHIQSVTFVAYPSGYNQRLPINGHGYKLIYNGWDAATNIIKEGCHSAHAPLLLNYDVNTIVNAVSLIARGCFVFYCFV